MCQVYYIPIIVNAYFFFLFSEDVEMSTFQEEMNAIGVVKVSTVV